MATGKSRSLPQIGELEVHSNKAAAHFAHTSEIARPGYYQVTLDESDIVVELTATAHAGFHRYTFPSCNGNRVLIDAGHTRGNSLDGEVVVVDAHTVEGYGVSQVYPLIAFGLGNTAPNTGVSKAYFSVRFERRFESFGTWSDEGAVDGQRQVSGPRVGAYLEFDHRAGRSVEAQVGISFIDVAHARQNRELEIGEDSFEEVRDAAVKQWNEHLDRIEVEGGTSEQQRLLSTALYHALMQPADYTEAGGAFVGGTADGTVLSPGGHHFYADDWCAWDTGRTTYPLLTLLDPEVVPDMVQSYVTWYEQAGWISKCTWHARGDSRVMTGNFPFCSIADAYAKGLRGFDVDKAFEAMLKGSLQDEPNPLEGSLCGYFNRGTPPDYVKLGYVPKECDPLQAASMTLEYAYNDWCVAQVAQGLGHAGDASMLLQRSSNWKNIWNPAHGFPQLKTRDGQFVEPFDPTSSDGFTEADAWKYLWSVPQDLCGLVSAVGGAAAFSAKLDELFNAGHFDIGNEPDFHAPYLYDFVGAPAKTAERVRALVKTSFSLGPDGLPGNDDAGATSAWLAFALIGLYPVTPGSGSYLLGSPHFDRVTLHVDRAKGIDFVIEAQDAAAEHPYIQSATLDGAALAVPRVEHADIVKGGKLVLLMGSTPSNWATKPICP